MEKDVKINIYLIRHGEKNQDGSSLSENGIKQTKLLAKRLNKIKIDEIISSDLPRCKETSSIILKKIKVPISYEPALREVEGDVKENPENHPKEIQIIKKFWDNLISRETGNILIVGSGNVNRIILGIAMEISPKLSRFVQIPSGLSHLELMDNNKIRMVYINDTSHLPEKLKNRQSY